MYLEKFIDVYDLKARVAPGLIALFPILFSVWIWFPVAQTWLDAFSSTMFAVFFSWMIGRIAREKGKAVEEQLFEKWGGEPTDKLLRLDSELLNPEDRRYYVDILNGKIPGLNLPLTTEDEAVLEDADIRYKSAVNWIKRNTRDIDKFPLLFKENVNYGFHRNLFGLKSIAVTVYVVISIINIIILLNGKAWDVSNYFDNSMFSIVVLLSSIGIWVFFITEKSVRSVSEVYSRRLIEALEQLK